MTPSDDNPHLRHIKQDCADFKALLDMPDRFPPRPDPGDGDFVGQVISTTSSRYFYTKAFIKRQPHRDELGLDIYGNPAVNPYIDMRLRNEAAALQLVAAHTTIPLPKLLGLWEQRQHDGSSLVYLKTAMVTDGVELGKLDPAVQPAAVAAVLEQLEADVLPQLRALRRGVIGSADPSLPVIPPSRFWGSKEKRVWPPVMGASEDAFVFCHNDLDRQNILVDPQTFRIVCLLDWETAGFYPAEWELLYLKANSRAERHRMSLKARDEHIRFWDNPKTDTSFIGSEKFNIIV
ncbi:Protein kinase-like domain protein [Niveomyces insectorum RCEF 264]|uniref:Protein kinase-like domain protein n=1 Tax=Niveomyces insectorum RCEF 264 TaxID=1081102 RepID=A0A167WDQ1_9HYPO|nr:Protein kinase-like domain protein [Niveomyces insectorum RCEF 264]